MVEHPEPAGRIDGLIEASSLGTKAAKAARESIPEEAAQEIVARVNALAAMAEIRKLHQPRASEVDPYGAYCRCCFVLWPCPTVAILERHGCD